MKKLCTLLAFGLTFAASAQNVSIYYTTDGITPIGADLSGGQYYEGMEDGHFDLQFKIVFSPDITINNLMLGVKTIASPANATTLLCTSFSPNVLQGTCYPPINDMFTSPVLTYQGGGNMTIQPKSHPTLAYTPAPGDGFHLRYYIIVAGNKIDSVDLVLNETLSIKDEPKVEFGMTAYPNPASEMLTVNTVGNGAPYKLKVTDVLGKVVYIDEVGEIKKLDVSDFKNGVYLVTVYDDNKILQTRRIVVKH